MKVYLATKEQLDETNQTLSEINSKIADFDWSKLIVTILDFANDDITITSGGYNSAERRIAS